MNNIENQEINNNQKKLLRIFYVFIFICLIFGAYYFYIGKYTVYFEKKELIINNGDSYQLVLIPQNYDKYNINNYVFKSSDSNIVSVDEYGMVKALSDGKTQVNVRFKNSPFSEKIDIKVSDVEVENIDIENEIDISENETIKLQPVINNEEKISANINYKIADESIAKVDNFGNVTGLKEGTTTIELESSNGKTQTIEVTIKGKDNKEENTGSNDKVLADSISISPDNTSIYVGDIIYLKAILTPSNTTEKKITWTTSDNNIASVDSNGKVTGKKEGSVVINAKTSNGKTNKSIIIVRKKTIDVTSIRITNPDVTLNKSSSIKLNYEILPSNATNKSVTWSSSNTSVATVDSSGKVTGKNEGVSTISIKSSNNKTYSIKVNVVVPKVKVTSVSLNKTSASIYINGTEKLTETISPTNATNKSVTWTSSNSSIVSVDSNGNIKGIKEGTATITVKTNDENKIATCNVTVKANDAKVSGVSLNKTSTVLDVSDTESLVATISPSNASNKSVTWSSSNTNIVSVDSNGKITAKKTGTATITVKTNDGNKTATCKVTVTEAKLYFMNLGPSDSIIITSKGKYAIVDASNDFDSGTPCGKDLYPSSETVDHVKNYLKSLGVSHIDAIVSTHSHCDHIGGMPVIINNFANSNTSYYYRTYIETNNPKGDISVNKETWDNMGYYNKALNAAKKKNLKLNEVTDSKPTFNLGNFSIQLLNTEKASGSEVDKYGVANDENANAIVEYLIYKGKTKILLASDMEKPDEPKVANIVGDIDILKMGHHGSGTSTSKDFINKLKPEYLIITNTKNVQPSITDYAKTKFNSKTFVTGDYTDAIVITLTNGITVSKPNGWYQEGNYWYYYVNNTKVTGWKQIKWSGGTNWFYFDSSGKMVTGWQQLKWNGKTNWYYFNNDGAMQTGWQQLKRNNSTNWYYFDNEGAMVTGWQKLSWSGGTNWFYFSSNGVMYQSSCATIDGKNYCFDNNGVCLSSGC